MSLKSRIICVVSPLHVNIHLPKLLFNIIFISSKSLCQQGQEIIQQVHSTTPEVYQELQDLWDVADGRSVSEMKVKVQAVKEKVGFITAIVYLHNLLLFLLTWFAISRMKQVGYCPLRTQTSCSK